MNYVTITEMNTLLTQLRAISPRRPLSFGEALRVAGIQAFRIQQWLGGTDARTNLAWLLQQRAVPVHRIPRYRLGDTTSGLTTDAVDGKLQIFVNQNEPHVRQRFTLAHELKHVLDFYANDTIYRRLGSGNAMRHHDQIEAVCNHFAAHLLMPTARFKRAWFRSQDVAQLAKQFYVSHEAVMVRLDKLGLSDEPQPPSRAFFRRSGLATALTVRETGTSAAAA